MIQTGTVDAEPGKFLVQLDNKMAAETCFFSMSLVDAVDRIVSCDLFFFRVDPERGFSFIAVRFDHDVMLTILLETKSHNSGAGQTGDFCLDVIIF